MIKNCLDSRSVLPERKFKWAKKVDKRHYSYLRLVVLQYHRTSAVWKRTSKDFIKHLKFYKTKTQESCIINSASEWGILRYMNKMGLFYFQNECFCFFTFWRYSVPSCLSHKHKEGIVLLRQRYMNYKCNISVLNASMTICIRNKQKYLNTLPFFAVLCW